MSITIKFGDICREVKLTTKDPIADGYEHYIGLEHLDSRSLKINRWGSIAEDKPSFSRVFKKGHILFGKRRPYLKKAAIADFDGICSGDIIVIEPLSNFLLPGLLPFIIQSESFWELAIQTSSGSLSPRTKFSALSDKIIHLTDEYKQNSTLAILKNIELCIFKREEIKLEINSFKRLIINETLKDIKTFKLLGDVVNLQVGYAFKSTDFIDDGVPLLRGANVGVRKTVWDGIRKCISETLAESFKEYRLKKGDLVIAMDRPFVNSGFKVTKLDETDDGALLVQRVGRFNELNGITPEYLWAILNSDMVRKNLQSLQKGMDIPHISRDEILSCKIPMPSEADQSTISKLYKELEILSDSLDIQNLIALRSNVANQYCR